MHSPKGVLFAGALGLVTASLIGCSAGATEGAEASRQQGIEIARKIVAIQSSPDDIEEQYVRGMRITMNQMRNEAIKRSGINDPDIIAIYDKVGEENLEMAREIIRKHASKLSEGLAQSYADAFTPTELEDIHAFASSSSGRVYFEKSPFLIESEQYARGVEALNEEIASLGPRSDHRLNQLMSEYHGQ